ncbi:hypothetical protein Hypma_001839 [Hypsizygus marmoreus]|uniref:Uncharacterized protein n=1 Tax=Hypsizygus marmoreus TaxID=39966 RepID=A0A369JCD1_HYPMA|nr:hypothetical protein Hypma_001839 [Hypsizygus marmoreus]
MQEPNYLIPTLIDSLKTSIPSFQELYLQQSDDSPADLFPILLRLVKDLHGLVVLSCPDFIFPDDTIRTPAESPNLHTFHSENDAEDLIADWRRLPENELGLTQLQHLSMRTKRIQNCSDLLKLSRPTQVEEQVNVPVSFKLENRNGRSVLEDVR